MVKTETKPIWTSSSFLVYAGGLTVLNAAELGLLYLAVERNPYAGYSGSGVMTAWTLLFLVILSAVALAFRRMDRWLEAGIFAFTSVIIWAVLVVVTLNWSGWENGSFRNFHIWSWPRLLIEVLILLAATVTRWRFKFPFIRLISALVGVLFVLDLVTKGHGNSVAVVSLLLGLAYLVYGHLSDKPSTFWLHFTAGPLIGAPIIYWCHHSTFDFAVIAFMSLVYVIWAYWTKRSSWAVDGTIGFFIVAARFLYLAVRGTIQSAAFHGGLQSFVSGLWYIPLAIGLLGFWLVLIGILGKRKKGKTHAPVKTETKPVWSSSSFLVYTGGLTVLLGANVGLVYLAFQYHRRGALAGWTLLFLAVIYGIALAFRWRGRWVAAGILAFVSVLVWATLVLLTMRWIGWHPFSVSYGYTASPLTTWSWSRMLFWVLVLATAWFDRWLFKFPFIRLISAVVFWLLLVDLLTPGHGRSLAIVTLLTGLGYLIIANFIDKPSAFWLHLIGGALIAGPLIYWFNTSDGDFAVISIFALLFVLVGYWTKRSSWTVYGTIGFFAATYHYLGLTPGHTGFAGLAGFSQGCSGMPGIPTTCTSYGPQISPWAPAVAFGLLGFWLVGLGMLGTLGKRKKSHKHAPVVVTTPAPPAATEPPAPPAATEPPAPPAVEDPPAE